MVGVQLEGILVVGHGTWGNKLASCSATYAIRQIGCADVGAFSVTS